MEYYVNSCLGGIAKLENDKAIKQLDEIKSFEVGQEIKINLSTVIYVKVEEVVANKVTIKTILKPRGGIKC